MSEESVPPIYLRAILFKMDDDLSYPGAMLPDGRIVFGDGYDFYSYRSIDVALEHHPRAVVYLHPQADEAINS